MSAHGGPRPGSGRKPSKAARPAHLQTVAYAMRVPRWLHDWLMRPDREASGPKIIEAALRRVHGIAPPGDDAPPPRRQPQPQPHMDKAAWERMMAKRQERAG